MSTKVKNKDEYLSLRKELKYDKNKWSEDSLYDKGYFNTILLFLTGACNLTCPGCFNIEQLGADYKMSYDYIKKVVDNNPDIEKYDIMGGEPLLHPDFDKIMKYLEQKNKKIGLYTNGFLLDRLKLDYKNLKINIAFHSLISINKDDKPITNIIEKLKEVTKIYPTKIVFLLTNNNKSLLKSFVKYVEKKLEVEKITIGTIRDESDYYNDYKDSILPISEYIDIINDFINTYNGKLRVDIFTEGVLYTQLLPKKEKYQLNRFRCVYKGGKLTTCLYDVGTETFEEFDVNKKIKFIDCSSCPKTGLENCLTDKIKLKRI